ncbi:Uncharacterised protein [Mycobacteroides abscessus subsp. abscessus]|nr:Uncharacterised protein [Mycobacteroides abscessus subsp. abscessus]
MLSGRSGAEFRPRDQNSAPVERFQIENEGGVGTPTGEEPVLETRSGDTLEVDRRDDLVGVHVGTAQRHTNSGVGVECLHYFLLCLLAGAYFTDFAKSAGDESFPLTAVAAATAGDTKWVRPPLPCRPSKFRFDVDAHR